MEYDLPTPLHSDVRSLMRFTEAEQKMNFLKNDYSDIFQERDEFCLYFYFRMYKNCILMNSLKEADLLPVLWEEYLHKGVVGNKPPESTFGW